MALAWFPTRRIVLSLIMGLALTTAGGALAQAGQQAPAGPYTELARELGAVLINTEQRDDGTWFDASGNDLHGTLVNDPVWHASGGPGEGLQGYFAFDGRNQYVDVGDEAPLRFTGPHTIVWWQRSDVEPQNVWAQVIGKGNSTYVGRLTSDEPRQVQYSVIGATAPTSDTEFLRADEWFVFMGRYTGTVIELWTMRDGAAVLIDAVDYDGAVDSTSERFALAAQDNDGRWRRWWRGHLAGALAFDVAIGTDDFEHLYTAATGAPVAERPRDPGPVEEPPVEEAPPEPTPAEEPPVEPPPAVEPPIEEPPPADEPPPAEPPVVEPPVVEPPAVEPPAVEPPAVEPPDEEAPPEPIRTQTAAPGRYELLAPMRTRPAGVVRVEPDGATHTIVIVDLDDSESLPLRVEIRFGTCAAPGATLVALEPILPGHFVSQTRVGVPLGTLRLGGFVVTVTLQATEALLGCAALDR